MNKEIKKLALERQGQMIWSNVLCSNNAPNVFAIYINKQL